MRKRHFNLVLVSALAPLLILAAVAFAFELPKWFPFTTDRSLDEWENKIFKGKTVYAVESDTLHALSRNSASAIFYKIKQRFRAQDYPMLSWKWKVVRFPAPDRLKERRGIERDDYAARVYVIFPSIFILSSRVLEYVWDENSPVESISDSPYSASIKLIVAHAEKSDRGKWILEKRNILEDYRKAFGREPSLRVGAIALMSDADNTADVAEAYFDDIKMGYKKGG